MPQYQAPDYRHSFSKFYLSTGQGNADSLQMDMALPVGSVNADNLFSMVGTGTTNATIGTTQAITHNLGVVPTFITIIPTSDGSIYLDLANPATATTFNVLGSVASLTFNYKVEGNGPANL